MRKDEMVCRSQDVKLQLVFVRGAVRLCECAREVM